MSVAHMGKVVPSPNESASWDSNMCSHPYRVIAYLLVQLTTHWFSLISFVFNYFHLISPNMKVLGQDESIANVAGAISFWSMILLLMPMLTFRKFLQSQRKNVVISFLDAFSIVIHISLSRLLTIKYQYKLWITGAMISTTLAYWIPNIG